MSYGAIVEKIVEVLPKVAQAIAEPLAKTEKMVFVSGGGGGGSGPSNFTAEMNRMMAQVPETVEALTGVDLRRALGQFTASDSGQ